MAAPTRQRALAELNDGALRIRLLLDPIPDEALAGPGTVAGGQWSVKDLVGHLATWEALALRTLQEWRAGETPWVEQPEGVFSAPATGKVDAFNARSIEEHRAHSMWTVRRWADRTHADLVAAIRDLADVEWMAKATYPTPNGRRRHLASLLGSILGAKSGPFRHAFDHIPELERFVAAS
jgi:Protein of unknown function (DUF1706)